MSTPECHKKPTPISEVFIEEVDDKIKFNIKPETPVVIAKKRKRPENDLEDSSLNLVSLFIWYLYFLIKSEKFPSMPKITHIEVQVIHIWLDWIPTLIS